MEIGLRPEEVQDICARLVPAMAQHRLGPVQLGRHAVDDARHRSTSPLIEEVLAVEGDQVRCLALSEEGGDGGRGAQPRVDPSLERHHEHRLMEIGLLVDREDLRQSLRAHGVATSAAEAMSAKRATCAGRSSTLP